jgi:signal transduction histidine kinase
MVSWYRYIFLLFTATRIAAMEILEADPGLSGRLLGPPGVDAAFGRDSWASEFRLNDYLVGCSFIPETRESAVLFGFRINQPFLEGLKAGGSAVFTFTVPRLHEGDAGKTLPVNVLLLERNATSAQVAADSSTGRLIGTIRKSELKEGGLYKFPLNDLGELKIGDVVWIGLNGKHPLDGKNHNFLVGGDLVSLPGSVPPMLIVSQENALNEPVLGMSPLDLLHRKLDAPKRPETDMKPPREVSNWVNPFTALRQIEQLDEIHRILSRELEKLPVAKRSLHGNALGFHSSTKPLGGKWTLRLPIHGVATALCLVPALVTEGDRLEPFAFPKRFTIVAHRAGGAGSLTVADWTSADFPQQDGTPAVFSFPWQKYDSIELTVHQGEQSGSGHFFAMEELFLYRPVHEDQFPTVVEIPQEDSIQIEPFWSPQYLTDGRTSLGPAYVERMAGKTESVITFPDPASAKPEITLRLEERSLIWSVELFPLNDADQPMLPSSSLPGKIAIDFATDPEFTDIVKSLEVSHALHPVPTRGNPVKIRFKPLTAKFIRLRCEELPVVNGVAQFGLAEIRANDAQSLSSAMVSLQGFPTAVNPQAFCDNLANGHRLADPLPWVIRLIRRGVLNTELAEVSAVMESLQDARLRTIRALLLGSGGLAIVLFCGLLLWVKQKGAEENMRVRRRIQQDLHDEIGSNLGTVSLVTSHLMRADLPPEVLEELSDVNQSAQEATSSLREVIWLTDKSILTLDKAFIYMQMRAEQMVHDCRLAVEAPKNVPSRPISSSFKRNLFLLFTEAIHNSQKHASASNVRVTLGFSDPEITVKVSDDGCGFDQQTVREGIGLQSMRNRAAQMAGKIQITSSPSGGTTVEFTANLAQSK